ncbi:MAG: HEAT repeat domain-containing protein [Planctomycetota bacterium]|nr:HEAT repeat domain-containing protein [Planctomycetota bacterium]
MATTTTTNQPRGSSNTPISASRWRARRWRVWDLGTRAGGLLAVAAMASLAGCIAKPPATPERDGQGASKNGVAAASAPTTGTGRAATSASANRASASGDARTGRGRTQALSSVERAELRERAAEMLVRHAEGDDAATRANAIEAMREAPERFTGMIERALGDSNEGVRAAAAMVAGWTSPTRYAPTLKTMKEDASPFVRASVIFALAKGDRDTDPTPLGELLLSHPSPRVRSHVALVLGELGNQSAAGLLKQAARERIPRASDVEMKAMQLQIAEALIKLGEDEQVDTLRAALYPARPEELELTALSVQIIGQVGDRGSTGHLKNLAFQRDPGGRLMPAEVRLAIAASLLQLGVPEAVQIADEYRASTLPAVRAQSAYVYGESRSAASLRALASLMDDPSPLVQVYAARGVLKSSGDARPASR